VKIPEDKFVPRPDILKRLKYILQPYEDQSFYHVVCGEHGTGKTTLIRSASREVGQDDDKGTQGGMGVIYVEIPSDPKDKVVELFGKAFGESLNFKFEEHISFTAQLMKKILGDNGKLIIITLYN
jgi:Cdc6-like AAA superfamily ATPase